jgi:hypothetical protein
LNPDRVPDLKIKVLDPDPCLDPELEVSDPDFDPYQDPTDLVLEVSDPDPDQELRKLAHKGREPLFQLIFVKFYGQDDNGPK